MRSSRPHGDDASKRAPGRGPVSLSRFGALVVMLALASASCTPSRVDPDAEVVVSGTVMGADGGEASGVPVLLWKEPDAIEILGTIASAGVFCLDDELPSACRRADRSETDGEGRFAFTLRGRDTQTSIRTAATMQLDAAGARDEDQAAGPATTLRFHVQTEELDLPMRFWGTGLGLVGDARSVEAEWSDPESVLFPYEANIGALDVRLRFEQRPDAVVWEQAPAGSGEVLDARLLEDSRGTVAVHASVRGLTVPDVRGSALDVILRSASYPYAARAGAPVSRGRPCTVPGPGGDVEQHPCRLTDGDFGVPFEPRVCPPGDDDCVEPQHTTSTVDLGGPTEITLVVVRGCPDRCGIETSADGASWQTLGVGEPDTAYAAPGNLALAPPAPVAARFVRVSADGGVERLRELSVWDASPPPEAAAPASLIVPPEEARTGAGDATGRNLAVAAVVLLLAAGTAILLARRRRFAKKPNLTEPPAI